MENSVLEIARKVHGLFSTKGIMLSVAESCTSGLVAAALTSEPGASEFFDSSVVAYSAHSKSKLLGLGESFIKRHGTVSEDTARAMAEAVRDRTGVDVGLAVTGVLGPGQVDEHEPGLVFIAVATPVETSSRGFKFEGSREEIRAQAARMALQYLYEAVSVWT